MRTQVGLSMAALLLGGCTAIVDHFSFDSDAVDAGNDASITDGGTADAGFDAGVDLDAAATDAGLDAGDDDAGLDAGADAGPGDAGTDGGTCVSDPSPTGIGLCTSDDGCPPHCSSNWEGHCVFGAYTRPRGTGTCIYRDCRLDSFEVDTTPHCPSAAPRLCPEMWCGRPAAPIVCPSAVQTCVY